MCARATARNTTLNAPTYAHALALARNITLNAPIRSRHHAQSVASCLLRHFLEGGLLEELLRSWEVTEANF